MRGIVVASLACLVLVGCGGQKGPTKGVISGKVTYNNQAVNGATLTLVPASGKDAGVAPNIPVSQDGEFHVADVVVGDYKITVKGTPGFKGPSTKGMSAEKQAQMQAKIDSMKTPATIDFPKKYTDATTTDLTCTVVKGENPPLKLELKD